MQSFKNWANLNRLEIPTIDQLKLTLQEMAYHIDPSQIKNVMVVLTKSSKETSSNTITLHALSLLYKKNGEFIYVDTMRAQSIDVSFRLEKFFDDCVTYIYEKYKIQIMYLMFDGPQEIEETSDVTCTSDSDTLTFKYFRFHSFSSLFYALRFVHTAFPVTSEVDSASLREYYDEIKILKETCRNLKISEAFQHVFLFLSSAGDSEIKKQLDIESIALKFLRGLQCNGTKLQNCTKIYNIKLYMLLNP